MLSQLSREIRQRRIIKHYPNGHQMLLQELNEFRLARYFELDKNGAVNNPLTSSVISLLYDGVTDRQSIADKPLFVRGNLLAQFNLSRK